MVRRDSKLPDDAMDEALVEFLRRQKADAEFKDRVWSVIRRWATAAVAIGLGVTTGWNLIERGIKLWTG